MDVSVVGKQVDIGAALRSHVEDQLHAGVKKYFDRAIDATVTVSRDGHRFQADISVHAGRGIVMQGGASAVDAYTAFDTALERIAKRLRRYKRRLRDHHKGRTGEVGEETLPAQYSVIAAASGDQDEVQGDQPVIIAEMSHEIATLTVGEAVMRMDLGNLPVLMFRNRAHNGLNVIYRRADGNVGWIDPRNSHQR